MSAEARPTPPTPDGAGSAKPHAPSVLQQWFPGGEWLRKYDWGKFTALDMVAAVSVVALLVPESMGYASVAGVPAQVGLYAAPLALVGYALFGGSRLLVFGAAGSVAAMSSSVVSHLAAGNPTKAVTYTAALALASGAVFLVAGLAKAGWIANFMSKAVMAGFITAMAISIIVGQLGKLTGVHAGKGNTFQKLWHVLEQISSWNLTATAIGVGSILLIFAMARYVPKIPAALTVVVIASVIVAAFSPSIDLVAKIPTGLPSFKVPGGISLHDWLTLLVGGSVVALVGFSEGWGAEEKIAETTHDQLNASQEFRAYGIGSLGAGILGGMPVTGSLSKSSVAMSAGAKSQMSNIFLALMVLLVLLVLAPALKWLPESALAAVVITAMWGSANPQKLIHIRKVDRIDFALGVIVAIVLLAVDLLPAMLTGIILSILYLVYKNSFPGRAELGRVEATGDFEVARWESSTHKDADNPKAHRVPGVIVYRLDAPLVFSSAQAFKETGQRLLIEAGEAGPLPKTLVVDCEEMFYADTTGAGAVSDLFRYAHRYGVELSLARLHSEARRVLELEGTINELGEDRIFDTVRDAVKAATAAPAGTEPKVGAPA
jgi:sulfate permease, SulP family